MTSVSSEMITLNVDCSLKCHQNMSGFISMCFLAFCRNKRERYREGFFLKRGKERVGDRLDKDF